ncbi:MAG TPA: hypothetical protein VGN90_16200 [Pyrinomonadaceae bacterium]|jgi:hypothetical protein|nr:hypothetical protein [Pyrinomonadaceae bacterium]
MDDLIRFVLRGALGGAIVPLFFVARSFYFLYDSPLFWYFLVISFWAAVPGAIIGMTLWFLCVRFVDRLGAVSRILIGLATGITIMVLVWMFLLWSYPGDSDVLNFPRMILSSLSNGASVGVLAGLFCPAATSYRREREPCYWERVRQYEEAQTEHEYWKAQLASGKSREDKRSA